MTTTTSYTISTLPNNLPALRTGTANDGRMLIALDADPGQRQSQLADIARRLPRGWRVSVWAVTGMDAVITHDE